MGKNVILPEQTVRDLLEAYASLAAWYYQLWGALRSGSNTTDPPEEAARVAFLRRLSQDYPELAALARGIPSPRMFVPPPPALPAPYADLDKSTEEPTTLVEPAPARLREMKASDPPDPFAPSPQPPSFPGAPGASATPAGVAPPPFVAPGTVKYTP